MKMSVANIEIVGIAPLSQSRQHQAPKLEGESHDDYDARTWREKLNVNRTTGKVIIPAHGIQQCLTAAVRRSGDKIVGKGNRTWAKVFDGGIALFEDFATDLDPNDAECVVISANADGVRGSGKRVPRRFPTFYKWSARGQIYILDPQITKDVMHRYFEQAGLFIGVGQFRPQNGGTNGRFAISRMDWEDNRAMVAA